MEEKSVKENLIECAIIMAIAVVCCYGLLWVAEKEMELGIHGKSSERLLVEKELQDNSKKY